MTFLVVANWKMNPAQVGEAKKIFLRIKEQVAQVRGVRTVICPPSVFLSELCALYSGTKISFGAQNASITEVGSFTGEQSAQMLKSAGASFCILGHSERRALYKEAGESDALIAKKVQAALAANLKVILCVGERERNKSGAHLTFIRNQLTSALYGLSPQDVAKLVIAYEPVWAIGKEAKDAMQPQDAHEMVLYIKKELKRLLGDEAGKTPVLYGGSVEAENCEALTRDGFVDGFLVGHASLVPKEFAYIVSRSAAIAKGR